MFGTAALSGALVRSAMYKLSYLLTYLLAYTLTYNIDFQSPASYSHDHARAKKSRSKVSSFKT